MSDVTPTPDGTHHRPLIARHNDGWGVYCEACSADADNYVFPCAVRTDDVFPKTAVLVERDRLLTELADEMLNSPDYNGELDDGAIELLRSKVGGSDV